MMVSAELSREEQLKALYAQRELINRRQAVVDFLEFMKRCWWMSEKFKIGVHTRAIANRLTRAVEDWERGVEALDAGDKELAGQCSTFLLVLVPFRHGKSDMCSRALPAWFLGRDWVRVKQNAEDGKWYYNRRHPDVIMTGYGAGLIEGFSEKSQMIIKSEPYRTAFPEVKLRKRSNMAKWGIEGSAGDVTAVGLGGSVVGKGGALIVVDDACKSREEAESVVYREKTWESFRDNVMTRRAPVSIVVVVCTPWHTADLPGRIEQEMKENDQFPRFEVMKFSARDEKGEFLFPERFTDKWYLEQYATLGPYSAAALLDCDPRPKGEQRFDENWFKYYGEGSELLGPRVRWHVTVDYASGEKPENCESVILVHGTDLEKRRFFHRMIRGRMGPERLKQKIVEVVEEFNPFDVGLENNCAKVLQEWVTRELKRRGHPCVVYELKSIAGSGRPQPGMAKLRIENLIAPYADREIFHNSAIGSEEVWNGTKWIERTIRGGELERQLMTYPSLPDDCADTAAYAIQQAQFPPGNPVFECVDKDVHRLYYEPKIRHVDERAWSLTIGDEPRAGRLARAIWHSREGLNAALWVHVDEDGCWTVFRAYVSQSDLRIFARDVRALSRDDGAAHTYFCDVCSALGGSQKGRGEVGYWDLISDAMREEPRVEKSAIPYPVESARIGKTGGLGRLDRMLMSTLARFPTHVHWEGMGELEIQRFETKDMLTIWPLEVIEDLKSARMAPEKSGKDQDADPEIETLGGGGPLTRCLRLLAVSV